MIPLFSLSLSFLILSKILIKVRQKARKVTIAAINSTPWSYKKLYPFKSSPCV